MKEFLFSYGTLQKEKVQMESFKRLLEGAADILPQYKLDYLKIVDESVLEKSEQQFHPIAFFTGNQSDEIEGMVFEVSMDEILSADKYEVEDYVRISTHLKSGKMAWVYVSINQPK